MEYETTDLSFYGRVMKMRLHINTLACAFLCAALTASICAAASAQESKTVFGARGNMHYSNFNWEWEPERRAAVDLNKLVVEFWADLAKNIQLEVEVEIEHGGTGSTMEFDRLEEFGEFEQEVEAGGEVLIEELILTASVHPNLDIQFGHLLVPVGLQTLRHTPMHSFTVEPSESESSLIPVVWHETGVGAVGNAGPLFYQALAVTGLDSTGFSSAAWVAGGHQTRFETVNADNIALAARLDYGHPMSNAHAGASVYWSDTADNRPKPDTDLDAHVFIADLHAVYESGPVKARGLLLYGALQNAGEISRLNRNLSNALNVKRTPVGSAALGWRIEGGYDIGTLIGGFNKELTLFGQLEGYDTMFRVPDSAFDNPRWDRQALTLGLNFAPASQLIFKMHYTWRRLGTETLKKEDTFSFGFGFVL